MGKYFTNSDISELLRKVASVYQAQNGNPFKIRAYEEAAVSIEHSTSDLKDLWDDGKLKEIPAVGESIAQHLDELFKTGKVKEFEKLFASVPPSLFVFDKIPGIGPKKAIVLARKLHIIRADTALKELKEAISKGRVKNLENFGEKSEELILKGIEVFEKGETKENRMPLYVAKEIADSLITYLKTNPLVLEAYPLGSLRRRLATIGDIDLAVATNKPKEVMEFFYKYPKIKRIISQGEKLLARVVVESGQQVDLRLAYPKDFGAMLQYFTGSKQHNIYLREYALRKGLSLSEYGIKMIKKLKVKNQKLNSKIKSFSTEKDFYNYLGLEYIPPEIREGTNEIKIAEEGKIPQLVELKDIKGDLHLHTNFPIETSHDLGESELKEMVSKGESLGYDYLGFTEHNPSFSQHSKREILNILQKKKEFFDQFIYSYEKENKQRGQNLPIKILNGLEIDIQPSGELAIPEEGFVFLDYAIASIHTSFNLNREEMTKRVIVGLSHPKVKIFGHPTGRKIGVREGYELDWEKIFNFCLKKSKFLEISAWPDRLDLPDILVREAIKAGIKLVINSDSHAVEQMELMEFGVSVARRGWAEKKDILNTLPKDKLSAIL
ncbi:DNA polymerase III [Candidatus Shapirobacteria bacterium CG03_land_8_20_14_0_80_39_12]|uniref:DNA-directed DNA polymerase n=1 Tax=Candidatus Shapirobacteria bacterium CG03_land_8_20_14_0_80_39_12 TaxID=1974879 RepID=A0A2M7BBU1_9BACT|nr:MAG: DNA polymerase III [Candidatus Shapirobacteria bacterium CG03_land_8_20_14_0_80_39_12]